MSYDVDDKLDRKIWYIAQAFGPQGDDSISKASRYRLVDEIHKLVSAARSSGYKDGLVAPPGPQLLARKEYAVKLRAEGKTIRQIVEIMGFKSPGSVSWLLKQELNGEVSDAD